MKILCLIFFIALSGCGTHPVKNNIYSESEIRGMDTCRKNAFIKASLDAQGKLNGGNLKDYAWLQNNENTKADYEIAKRVYLSDFKHVYEYTNNEMIYCAKNTEKVPEEKLALINKCLDVGNYALLAAVNRQKGMKKNEMSYPIPPVTLDYIYENQEVAKETGGATDYLKLIVQNRVFSSCIEPDNDYQHLVYPAKE